MYQKYTNEGETMIYRISDGAWIPVNPDNSDYRVFLQYLTDNNLTLNDIPNYNAVSI